MEINCPYVQKYQNIDDDDVKKKIIIDVCEKLSKSTPNPKVELDFSSGFECLVAVLLSAQTTDIRVNIVTKTLFQIANTPEKIIDLGLEKLSEIIKSIGLYKNKAKNIIALSEVLAEKKYKYIIPDNMMELTQLPGIGRKSANVVLNAVFNQPAIAVDTHVIRLTNRLHIVDTKNPEEIEYVLQDITPKEFKKNIGNYLVLHGRYVCKAKKPECEKCVLFCSEIL